MKSFKYAIFLISILWLSSLVLADSLPAPSLVEGEVQPQSPLTSAPISIAGTETRLLPANIDVWACDWAPDGKSLVFCGKAQGDAATKMRIWHWAQEPVGDPSPLTSTDGFIDFSPRWAPDGKKIAIIRRSIGKSDSVNINSALWLKEIPGGAGRQLTKGPQDRDPSWSPDGTKIVFSRGQGPYQAKLYIADLNANVSKMLAGNDGELLNTPWWGVDGKIYFTKLSPYTKTVNVSGQSYQVMDFGRGGIWAIEPSSKVIEPVVVDEFDNRLPALSPDGSKLAFVSNRNQDKEGNGKYDRGSLYIKDLKTGEIIYITNKVGLNGGSLSWRPDGKRLAFFTFRSIRPAIWVINIPDNLK